ncbi:rhamnan synthesis F family protein [Enterococcus sp. LJL90]
MKDKLKKIHYYSVRMIKEPRLIRVAGSRIKQKLKSGISRLPNPQAKMRQRALKKQRELNNYENPSRVLIYVIFENQARLQEYKIVFLKALAKLSPRVLIVVNGSLPESDEKRLAKIGEVVFRENSGYDTAAFKFGVDYLGKKGLADYDELLLVNDTNVGPIGDLAAVFQKMAAKRVDFWGISYGEEQGDITGFNPYGYIPVHLQSYFLVIEKSLFLTDSFFDYWRNLGETNTRFQAIGRHETVFTKHFADLGYLHSAVTLNNQDSAMYIHPLTMLQEGVPLIKYSAFSNYDNQQFVWQGLQRETEVPALLNFLKTTDYPPEIIETIMQQMHDRHRENYVLIIDGVENVIPQLTKYRVENKVEQLRSTGLAVRKVNLSELQLKGAQDASHIIIYRASYTPLLEQLIQLANQFDKPVLYDIDDLVIDTKYTDMLSYTQGLSKIEKENYDASVNNYQKMLMLCDGSITSTGKLQEELYHYKSLVLLNRNLANDELVAISQEHLREYGQSTEKVAIGYFSGSITHNENFELIKPAIIDLLKKYPYLELHLVGHLDVPKDIASFKEQIVTHDFVDWRQLPALLSQVDINLAPLVTSIFNEAKSEIKWLEAALVKVPTVASDIGAFREMIQEGKTGILVNDHDWFEKLEALVIDQERRQTIAEQAYQYVLGNCVTENKVDGLVEYLKKSHV